MQQRNAGAQSTVVTLAIFVRTLVRELRWKLLGATSLAILLALAEGVGLLLLLPLLQTIGLTPGDGAASVLASTVSRAFAAVGLSASLGGILAVFLLVSCARAVLERANLMLQPALELQFAVALRKRLQVAIAGSEWSFFVTRRSTDLVHALTRQVDRASASAFQMLSFFTGGVLTAVYVAVAYRLSAPLTVLVAVVGCILLWATGRGMTQAETLGQRDVESDRDLFHITSESISALKLAKIVGAQHRDSAKFAQHARRRADAYLALLRSYARAKMGVDLASALVLSGLLLVAVHWLNLRGTGLLLLILVFARVMPRVMALQNAAQVVVGGLPAFQAVQRLMDDAEAHAEHTDPAATRLARRGDVQLVDVFFVYAGSAEPVLNRVSLRIPAGRTTAIVGTSGAGKSTLADILLGLLWPTGGQVLVDGEPLDQADVSGWRRSVGYVPQDGFLLHDTIRANLLWAVPAATEARMWEALSHAAAADFVRARAEGLDAVVGDRGVRLSGGERQRLALARALLADPDLLVLDEATSALDSANENQILRAVCGLDRRITTVIITHRLSAIRDADTIHVLHDGRLVESGTWAQLVALRGRFAELLRAQEIESREPDLCEHRIEP